MKRQYIRSRKENTMQITVLKETPSYIAVHKIAGMAVETRRIDEMDLESLLKSRSRSGQIYPIHRLDQVVEGIVLFAKEKRAAGALTEQMVNGSMKKRYIAVVHGRPEKPEGYWTDYLMKTSSGNYSCIQDRKEKRAKRAELFYQEEAYSAEKNISRLSVMLMTGRHHQIRVQLAHHGIPIVGDRKYGKDAGVCGEMRRFPMLCAAGLTFLDPDTHEQVQLEISPSWNEESI